jgi:hypothetical protein
MTSVQNNIFNNTNNRKIINNIINDDIFEEYKISIDNKYNDVIESTIQYVESKGGTKPPKNMSNENFIYLMNKKVYDIVIPIIKDDINKKQVQIKPNQVKPNQNPLLIQNNNITNQNPQSTSSPSNNIFDPQLLKYYEKIDTVMEYPKPGFSNKKIDEQFDNKLKNIEEQRQDLKPKLRPIDFALKKDEPEDSDKAIQKFNALIDSIGLYDNKNPIEQNSNSEKFTPITSLNNQSNLQSSFNSVPFTNQLNTQLKPNNNYDPISIVKDNSFQSSVNNVITNFNNDQMIQNSNQKLEFSSFKTEGNNIIVQEPTFDLLEYTEYIIVDSADRDLELWPNPTQFQIKFAPAPSNLLFNNYYDDKGRLILREKNIVYGNTNLADIDKTFDNIKTISCSSSTVPVNNVNIASNKNSTSYLNIFQEPYLFLEVPELRGPYRSLNRVSRNAFSKFKIDYSDYTSIADFGSPSNTSYFTTLQTINEESFIYQNTTLGKIDKMTLSLTNKNGNLYNVGIDKLYVQSIRKGNLINSGYCGEQFYSTIIKVQRENDQYIKYCSLYYRNGNCNYLNSIPMLFGDYLQFYSIYPDDDQIAYLEDYIKIDYINKDITNNTITFKIGYLSDGEIIYINFKYIVPELNEYNLSNYYLILYNKSDNKTYYLKVKSIDNSSITVNYINIPDDLDYNNSIKIGIAKGNLRGNVNYDKYYTTLFDYGGYYVLGPDNNQNSFEVEINFPHEKLPFYLKNMEYYNPGDIFFIQKKLQINYTFAITYFEKDYKQNLTSLLNEASSK